MAAMKSDKWYHLAAVYDGTGDHPTFYVDGDEVPPGLGWSVPFSVESSGETWTVWLNGTTPWRRLQLWVVAEVASVWARFWGRS